MQLNLYNYIQINGQVMDLLMKETTKARALHAKQQCSKRTEVVSNLVVGLCTLITKYVISRRSYLVHVFCLVV